MEALELARIVARAFRSGCPNRSLSRYSVKPNRYSRWKRWELKIIQAVNSVLPENERIPE